MFSATVVQFTILPSIISQVELYDRNRSDMNRPTFALHMIQIRTMHFVLSLGLNSKGTSATDSLMTTVVEMPRYVGKAPHS